jgi:hypothetical protein
MIEQRRPADYRPITDDDIASATRALGLTRRDTIHVKETLDCHRGLNAFASAVIAKACEAELERRQG